MFRAGFSSSKWPIFREEFSKNSTPKGLIRRFWAVLSVLSVYVFVGSFRSEKWQNESSPNFSNFCPELSSRIFPPNFSRSFRASFPRKTETSKNSPKIPALFQCKIPRQIREKKFTNIFWRAGVCAFVGSFTSNHRIADKELETEKKQKEPPRRLERGRSTMRKSRIAPCVRQVPECTRSMCAPSCELWRTLANFGEPTTPYSREPP